MFLQHSPYMGFLLEKACALSVGIMISVSLFIELSVQVEVRAMVSIVGILFVVGTALLGRSRCDMFPATGEMTR